MAILGIDVGNSMTKSNKGVVFDTKYIKGENLLGTGIKTNRGITIGEGNYDTEYRKIKKDRYIDYLHTAIALSTEDLDNEIVVGLPISQYKKDREELIELISNNAYIDLNVNNKRYKGYITNVNVYPEGIASISNDFEGVIVDIGGRTTDACFTYISDNNKRKIDDPISIPAGTLNLYNNFINVINSKYVLDLKSKDAQRIIKNGLKIEGEYKDINFAIDVFKDFLDGLIKDLNLHYALSASDVLFVGGGSLVLQKPIMNRLKHAQLADDCLFSNANGFYRIGCDLFG